MLENRAVQVSIRWATAFADRWLTTLPNRIVFGIFILTIVIWHSFWPTLIFTGIAAAIAYKLRPAPWQPSPPRDISFGSARWAGNYDLNKNIMPRVTDDRYILGLSSTPDAGGICLNPNAYIGGAYTKGSATEYPLITTGPKTRTSGQPIDDGHLITIAGAGAGKSISVVWPNLMTYEGPTIVFDPKGESFLKTHQARERLGHRVCLIDPFSTIPAELRSRYNASFNPLDTLAELLKNGDHGGIFDETAAIAEMIIVKTPKDNDPHWNEKASQFLKAAILFTLYAPGYQDRKKFPIALTTVKDCILYYYSKQENFEIFVDTCQRTEHLSAMGSEISMIEARERSSVLASLSRHTEFLNSINVRGSVGESTFKLHDLKTQKISVYLVLPANRIQAYSRLARLWIGSILEAMMRDAIPPERRVLFMLDEVAQLGALESLINAVGLARGYGVDLWLLYQDIPQLKGAYGDRWQTFLANAKVQQFFGVRDLETANYVSEKLGFETIQTTNIGKARTINTGTNVSFGSSHGAQGSSNSSHGSSDGISDTDSITKQSAGRLLMQPNEVMRLGVDELIICIGSEFPARAQRFNVLQEAIQRAIEELHVLKDVESKLSTQPVLTTQPAPIALPRSDADTHMEYFELEAKMIGETS